MEEDAFRKREEVARLQQADSGTPEPSREAEEAQAGGLPRRGAIAGGLLRAAAGVCGLLGLLVALGAGFLPLIRIALISENSPDAEASSWVRVAPPAGTPGETRIFAGMEFVWVGPGSFMMGSPSREKERTETETHHEVSLTKGFWLGKYEVMQGQWEAAMDGNPSRFKGRNLPVERVSWHDVQDFIAELNARGGEGFRLPTEAEWEYACRAGVKTPFSSGKNLSTDQANYDGNEIYARGRPGVYLERTAAVGGYPPNPWGLYDMHGNVWEWCQDWFGDYPRAAEPDPEGADGGMYRVLRGGSWRSGPGSCRSANRSWSGPAHRNATVGFRLAW